MNYRNIAKIAAILLSCFMCLMLWEVPQTLSAPAGYSVFYVPADETNMATVFEDSAAGSVDDLGLINGYLDMDYDLSTTTPDADDDGFFLGYAIVNGGVDINGSGTITTTDDGTLGAYNVYDGRIDINSNGSANDTDDGVFVTEPMRSIIGITAWTDDTHVYIDHWEDGYDMDLDNPDATADEIIPVMNSGDQRTLLSRNVPSLLTQRSDPGDASPTDCKCINGDPGVTPEPGCYYDGKDKIYAVGGTITLTRAMLPESATTGGNIYAPANVQAVSWEVYPVRPQLTTYILPFGENLGTGFEIVQALIQATEDNTTVQIDFNNDGVFDAIDFNRDGDCNDATDANAGNGYKITLQQGEAMLLDRNSDGNGGTGSTIPNGNLNTGTQIKGSKTLQVQYTVGDPASTWEIRNYSAFPRGLWDDEYYAPVPGMTNGNGTDIYLHNVWNTPLTVNYEHRFGSGSIIIPANSTISYYTATGNTEVPNNTAVHFRSTDGRVFWGVSAIDRNGQNFDWSYSLVPAYLLTNEYFIGWAPSNSALPPTGGDINSNGIYLTPAQDNTQVYVDYDRNGTVDSTYTLNRLQTIFLCDNDNDAGSGTAGNSAPQNDADMSGAAIWATGPFIAAYGQNSDNTDQTAGFDLGYTTLPDADWIDFVIDVDKSTDPAVLGTGTGEIAKYTIVVNTAEFDVDNIKVTDTLAAGWSFCDGTTTPFCVEPLITFPNGSTINADPTISGQDLTWDSSNMGDVDMGPNQILTIEYYVYTSAPHALGSITTSPVTAYGERTVGIPAITQTFNATDRVFNMYTDSDMLVEKWSKTAGNCGSDSGNDLDILYPGDSFCYRVKVTNIGSGPLTRIGVFDTLPAGVTYTAASTSNSHSTVADDFTTAAYSNNAGTRNWGGDWTETGDDGTATGDDILITNGELQLNNDDSVEPTIYRQIDLTGATSAVLSFKWRTTAGVTSGDSVRISARTSNAAAWDDTLTGGIFTNLTGINSGTYSVDLVAELGAISSTTQIRFLFDSNDYDGTAANESFLVDDLSITYNISDTNGSPPNLVPGNYLYALLPGQSLAVSFSVTVDDPLITSATELTNTAAATSAQISIPEEASVTDPVVIPSPQSGTVGDRVWLDADGDGVLDVGEAGIAGVTVTLKDQYGTPLQSTTTDSQGRYQFTGVSFGTGYYVEVTGGLPAGLTQTTDSRIDNRTNAFGLIPAGDYRDNFGTVSYVNSDGSLDWTTATWIESDPRNTVTIVNGYLDLNGSGGQDADDAGNFGGYAIINGGVDINGSGTITNADDGTILGFNVYNGRVDINNSGAADNNDDGGPLVDTDLARSGEILIIGGQLRINGNSGGTSNSIRRSLNIPDGATSATLTFDYSTAGVEAVDSIVVEVAADGGNSFTPLATYTGLVGTTGPTTATFDLTPYLSPDTRIRFRVSAGYAEAGDYFYVDNFRVQYSGAPDFENADLGYKPSGGTAVIGDRVWSDADGDGVQDAGEPGLGGVEVRLYPDSNGDGNIDNTTIPVIDGTLDLDGDNSITSADTGHAGNRSIVSGRVDINGDGVITTVDDGNITIGGTTYTVIDGGIDFNGVGGVTTADDGTTGADVNYLTAITAADGSYFFNVRASGTEDYVAAIYSGQTALSNYNLTTLSSFSVLNVTNGGIYRNADFGAVQKAVGTTYTIKDRIWSDTDGDGVQDTGEAGIPGVTMDLLDASGATIATATTDANGDITFTGVPEGVRYRWRVTDQNNALANYFGTTPSALAGEFQMPDTLDEADDIADGTNDDVLEYSDPSNPAGYRPHFGYNISRSIGDTVFNDNGAGGGTAGNGLQDGTEPGISGVVVRLYNDADGDGVIDAGVDLVQATQTTNANGRYLFSGLANGNYIVSIESPPSGYSFTGTGAMADSDGTRTGQQNAASVSSGGSDLSNDFGYQANSPRTISGTVWDDADQGKDIDGSEGRIAGVTVELYQDTDGDGVIDPGEPRIGTATTVANGVYTFSGIQGSGSEDYVVRITDENGILSGHTTTYEGPNTDGTNDDGNYNGEQAISNLNGNVTRNFGYKKPVVTRAVIGKFGAFNEGGKVVVRWQTVSEHGTIGFFLQRRDEKTGRYQAVNNKLLPGLLHSPAGGDYSYEDKGAKTGAYYTYRLEEVEAGGRRILYGPWRVFTGTLLSKADASVKLKANRSVAGFKSAEKPLSKEKIARLTAKMEARLKAHADRLSRKGVQAKIYVKEDGLYFIDAADIARVFNITLKKATGQINSNSFRLRCQDQPVALLRAADNSGIYFYGEKLKTRYTDENVYWLDINRGVQMQTVERGPTLSAGNLQYFHQSVLEEKDQFPMLTLFTDQEADFWMWDFVFPGFGYDQLTFPVSTPGVVDADTAVLTVRLKGASDAFNGDDHHAVVRVNGVDVGEALWNGFDEAVISANVSATLLNDGENQLQIAGIKNPNVPYNYFYVNNFEIVYPRSYAAVDSHLSAMNNGYQTLRMDGFKTTDIRIFDITKPLNPLVLTKAAVVPSTAGGGDFQVSFAADDISDRYLALTPDKIKPCALIADKASSLKTRSNKADYVIITRSDMVDAAKTLADYRASQGHVCKVVDIEDIYDEFAYGVKDAAAIRDFLAYAQTSWRVLPKYVFLAGDGSIDYLDGRGFGDSIVPALLTGTPEGLSVTDFPYSDVTGNDFIPEFALGRIPVISAEELSDYVEKVMGYEAASGQWTTQAVLAADAPDAGGNFPSDSEALAGLFPNDYLLNRVYMDTLPINTARANFLSAINGGQAYVNFIGHGGPKQIGNQNLLSTNDLSQLHNGMLLPVFTAMTCAAGSFGVPGVDGLSEALVLLPGAGAIAMWAPSGYAYNARSVELCKGFYSAIWIGGDRVLGDAILSAQTQYQNLGQDLYHLDLYNLMGDPALRLK